MSVVKVLKSDLDKDQQVEELKKTHIILEETDTEISFVPDIVDIILMDTIYKAIDGDTPK